MSTSEQRSPSTDEGTATGAPTTLLTRVIVAVLLPFTALGQLGRGVTRALHRLTGGPRCS